MVNFIYGSLDQYKSLQEKNPESLYFITDAQRIYKGNTLVVSTAVQFVTALPATASAQQDILYVYTDDLGETTLKKFNGTDFVNVGGAKVADSVKAGSIVFESFSTETISQQIGAEPSTQKLVTEKAVTDYVDTVKQEISGQLTTLAEKTGKAFVAVSTGDSETAGKFKLNFTDNDGIVHSIDLDKEKFLKSASLSPDGKTLTLTMTDDTTVDIDLAEIVADATTVKTTEDIVVTTAVGELKANEVLATGTSVQSILVKMLSQEKNPSKTNPAVGTFIVNNNGSGTHLEAGTSVTPKWNAAFSAGSYTYKSTASKDPITPVAGTGVTAQSWSIKKGSDEIGTAASGTGEAFILGDATVQFTATVNYSAGNFALTNLNKLPETDVQIAEGSASRSASITSYRNMFYGGVTSASAALTSDLIRSLGKSENPPIDNSDHSNDGFVVAPGTSKIIVAIPATNTKKVTFEYYTMSWSADPGFSTTPETVQVADARGGANGMVDYKVYTWVPSGGALEANTRIRFTLS